MADISTSSGADIYKQLGVGVTPLASPQDQLAKALQTGNNLIGFQNNAAQIGARNALAGAYANAPIDPATGMPDQKAVLSALSRDPRGAWMMPQVIQNLQEQQGRTFSLNKQQLEQTTARTNVANNAFTPLLRMGNSVTPTDIMGQVAGLHASGFPTDEIVQDMSATMPPRQPGMSDQQYGAQLQGWLTNHASRSWGADTSASKFTPNVTSTNNGGHIVFQDTNAITNPGIVGSSLRMQMTPPEEADQVKGPLNAQGQPTVIPRAEYARQNAMGYLVPGAAGSDGQSSAFGASGGRLPQALMNTARPGAAPPPVPGSIGAGSPGYAPAQPAPGAQGGGYTPVSTAGGGYPPTGSPDARGGGFTPQPPAGQQTGAVTPMAVGLSPSQNAGQTAAGDASAKQWAALQSSVGGSAARMYQLQAGLRGLVEGGPTGPSSGTINTVKSYLQSLPVIGQNLGFDANQIASYDEANKYLQQYAAARAGRFGGTTDQQLATTLSSNASTHISGLAAQDVVKANMGLERMDQAQLAGFQNGLDPVTGQPTGAKLTPDQFSDYSAKWNTANDARAFVADQLSPQQFAATVSGMQPPERARFQQTFNNAVSNGWMDPPAWMQAPAAGASGGGASSTAAPAVSAPPAAIQPAPAALPLNVTGTSAPAAKGG